MTTLFIPCEQGLAAVRDDGGSWRGEVVLDAAPSLATAVDPGDNSRVYATTLGGTVWRSDDAGRSWHEAGNGIAEEFIWSVAVSASERGGDGGVVYVGTELSNLYRSEDGGSTWIERTALQDVPSRPNWSYPPKPDTHHVRCILPDPVREGLLFLGIEQGGLLRSEDGGETISDHNQQACIDPHTLGAHAGAGGRVYEAAGDGYSESTDYGQTWQSREEGIEHPYLYGMAIDSGDPETIVISAAPDPFKAHNVKMHLFKDHKLKPDAPKGVDHKTHDPSDSWATLYRRSAGSSWEEVTDGLPERAGSQTSILAAHPAQGGAFYLTTVTGELYGSADGGASWERLQVSWPDGLELKTVRNLAVGAE